MLSAEQARADFYKLIDHVADSHKPVCINGKRNKVIMLSEDDFNAIQETVHILSVPGMHESIDKAQKEPLDEGSDKLDW